MDITIERLAALARLSLNEKEKERFEADLTSILAYVDQLREVDAKDPRPLGAENFAEPEMNRLREDVLTSL